MSEEDATETSGPTDEQPGIGTSVFVAEDEAIIRLDIVETLTAMGYEVVDYMRIANHDFIL